ncbi:hypothetical protein [Brachybacterium hainanense]|uniref:Uncharacterized protein n=1 Tax=Brachybacterium hainanense TaxID=1541174 RepID=A0ABV6R961_9MICO
MDLSTIPVPEKTCTVTVVSHTQAYPTVPGCTSGIVEYSEGRATVQCAVCLRTATGRRVHDPIVHAHWDHAGDDYDVLTGPRNPHTPYKRCPDCKAARRHPPEQLDLLSHLATL